MPRYKQGLGDSDWFLLIDKPIERAISITNYNVISMAGVRSLIEKLKQPTFFLIGNQLLMKLLL